ncbi:hypothetical protein BH23VER1_BH23VER1_16840 [soil metagenome]
MTFVHPQFLYLAIVLLPLFVTLKVIASSRGRRALHRVVAPRLSNDLVVGAGGAAGWIAAVLQIAGILLVVAALARPQWGHVREESTAEGRNIILALDTSRSMLAPDLAPDRLQRARLAAQDLVRSLPNDRFGVIAFAGQAFIQAPLTIDHAAVIETLTQVDTSLIPRGGTNIENAIALAAETFKKSEGREHALILFTDGDDLEGDAAAAAEAAREEGVMLVAVGVGTTAGELIPEDGIGGTRGFVRDRDGNTVLTRLDRGSLSELALLTRGVYVELGTQASTQLAIVDALDELERTRAGAKDVRRPVERFQWFLGAAFFCFTFAFLTPLVFAKSRLPLAGPATTALRPAARAAALVLASSLLALPALPAAARADAPPPTSAYDALVGGDYESAMERYGKDAEDAGTGRAAAEPNFGLGAAAYRAGEFDRALEAYGRVLLSPAESRQETAHYNLGNTLYRRGEATRDAPPAEPDAGPDLRQLESAARDWHESVNHYGAALDLNPDNEDARFNKQVVEEQLEELEQQIQEVQQQQGQQGQQGQEGQEGQDGQAGQEGQEGQEGEGRQKGQPGQGDGDGNPGDGQAGQDDQDDGEGGKSDFENPSPEKGGGDGDEEEADRPGGKLEAMGSREGSGSGTEISPDRVVDPETGFSKFQARQLLEFLADEDLNARPADRAQTNESYKNW